MAEGETPKQPAAAQSAGRGRRKPAVTIDLEADRAAAADDPVAAEDGTEEPAAARETRGTSEPPPRQTPPDESDVRLAAPPRRQASAGALLAFALMGALVVLIGGYLLMFTDILQAPGTVAADEAKAESAAVADDLEALRQALAAQSEEFNAEIGALPPPDLTPLEERIAALETSVADLAALRADVAALTTTVDRLGQQIADEEAARRQLADDLAALRRESVAAAAAGGDPVAAVELGEDINALSSRVAALEDTGTAGTLETLTEEVNALGDRLDAFEAAATPDELSSLQAAFDDLSAAMTGLSDRVAALAEDAEARSQTQAAARALAVANLRNAAASGEPFLTELTMLSEFGVAAAALEPLQDAALSGVPSRQTLADAFPEIADAILTASSTLDPDAGFWEVFWHNARNAVVVVPTTPVEGDDPPAVVSRMRAAALSGDFATALAEREGLPPEGLEASEDWAASVNRRIALDTAVEALSASVLGSAIE